MIHAIDQRARAWDGRRLILWVLAALPLALGWCVGIVFYSIAFIWQSFLAGYRKGRGIE